MIYRTIAKDSPLLKYKDVQLYIWFTAENVDAINIAQQDFGQNDKGDNSTSQGNSNREWDNSNKASVASGGRGNNNTSRKATEKPDIQGDYSQNWKLDETGDWGESEHINQATIPRKVKLCDIGVGDIVNVTNNAASTVVAMSVSST